jgi:hypothetical protein
MARGQGGSARRVVGLAVTAIALVAAPAIAAPSVSPSGLIVFDIRDPGRIADIAGSLQGDLLRLGLTGRVVGCGHAVHLTSGRPDGNDYFGAVCGLEHAGRRSLVVMCDDRMVGRFALKVAFAMTQDDVARFTDANCTGG